MPIRDPYMYSDGYVGPGKISTLENYRVNTETAGADIKFGQAVVIKNGVVIPATKAPIYGIALNRDYTNSQDFIPDEMENDHYSKGNGLDVLRDGTISVPISEDVTRGENATVDANGEFKPAGANDTVVGVFLNDGDKDKTASLQTRIQFGHGNADDDAGAAPSTPTPSNNSGAQSSSSPSNNGKNK